MRNEVGIWLDYKHAVIVINLDQEEEIKQIASHMEKPVSSASQMDDISEEEANIESVAALKRYNDEIISYLRTASSVLIMGPGEAKVELQKRLAIHGFDEQVVVVKTAKKMSEKQIIADIHRYFRETQYGI